MKNRHVVMWQADATTTKTKVDVIFLTSSHFNRMFSLFLVNVILRGNISGGKANFEIQSGSKQNQL